MKKKGFTLVELLAVIAILAILVIIALPNVLGMFNSAKKNTFVTEVQSIYKEAQTDFINDNLNSAGAKHYCSADSGVPTAAVASRDGSTYAKCKPLNLTTTKKYYISLDADGNVTHIGVRDGSFLYGKGSTPAVTDIKSDYVWDASAEATCLTSGTTYNIRTSVTKAGGDSN